MSSTAGVSCENDIPISFWRPLAFETASFEVPLDLADAGVCAERFAFLWRVDMKISKTKVVGIAERILGYVEQLHSPVCMEMVGPRLDLSLEKTELLESSSARLHILTRPEVSTPLTLLDLNHFVITLLGFMKPTIGLGGLAEIMSHSSR